MDIKEGKVSIRRYTLKYGNDFTKADTSDYWDLPLPDNDGYLTHFYGRVKTAFAGVTAPHVKVGDPNILDSLIPIQRIDHTGVLVPGGVVGSQYGCAKMDLVMSGLIAPKIRVTIYSSAGNLSSISAGEIEFVAVWAS